LPPHRSGKGNSKNLPEAHCQLWHMPLAMKHTLVYTSMMIMLLKLMNQLHPENVFIFPVTDLKGKQVYICRMLSGN
jgi:hypothetical protein